MSSYSHGDRIVGGIFLIAVIMMLSLVAAEFYKTGFEFMFQAIVAMAVVVGLLPVAWIVGFMALDGADRFLEHWNQWR